MKRILQNPLISLVCLFFTTFSFSAHTKEILGAFPGNIAPWMLEKEDSGYMLEIVRTALQKQGITIKSQIVPLARIGNALDNPEVQLIGWGDERFTDTKVFPYQSEPVGTLSAELFWLESSNFQLNKVDDLNKVPVIAFQGAGSIWPEIGKVALANKNYKEMHDQMGQVQMLFLKRTTVILLDKQIFNWWKNHITDKEVDTKQKTSNSVFISKLLYNKSEKPNLTIVFRSQELRDKFNQGFEEMKKNGDFEKIRNKYGMDFN